MGHHWSPVWLVEFNLFYRVYRKQLFNKKINGSGVGNCATIPAHVYLSNSYPGTYEPYFDLLDLTNLNSDVVKWDKSSGVDMMSTLMLVFHFRN